MMLEVTIRDADDAVVGWAKLAGSTLIAHPVDLLDSPVFVQHGDELVDVYSDAEPEAWIRGLHNHYKSAYFRASEAVDSEEEAIVERENEEFAANAFCPTGPGGGVDDSCSPRELADRARVATVKAGAASEATGDRRLTELAGRAQVKSEKGYSGKAHADIAELHDLAERQHEAKGHIAAAEAHREAATAHRRAKQ
jgi:hypothetical protein